MILRSWLVSLFRRLENLKFKRGRRNRRAGQTGAANYTEFLERRKMLTALNISGNTQPFINGETQFFPYPSFSTPAGTSTGVNITVSEPAGQTPVGAFYTPGPAPFGGGPGLSIVGGNNDNAFRISGASQTLVINNPYAINAVTNHTIPVVLLAVDSAGNTAQLTVTFTVVDPGQLNMRPVVPQFPYSPLDPLDATPLTGDDSSASANNNFPLAGLAIETAGVNVFRVKENSGIGTVLGNVKAEVPDHATGTLTYTLDQSPGFTSADPAFAVDPFTGAIRVVDPSFLDFEARALNTSSVVGDLGENPAIPGLFNTAFDNYADVVLDLEVHVTNTRIPGGALSSMTTQPDGSVTTYSHIYIRLLDVGEVPPNVSQATKQLSVIETAPPGLSVGFFEMIDGTPNFTSNATRVASPGFNPAEPQQRMSFTIVGGDTPLAGNTVPPFNINPDTGEITIATSSVLPYALDYAKVNSYNLQIQVTSDNPNADSLNTIINQTPIPVQNVVPLTTIATLHIAVTPDFLPVTIPSGQSFRIPEGAPNGLIVGALQASDPDTQPPNGQGVLQYSIISGNSVQVNGVTYSGLFSIDSATGVISVNNSSGAPNSVVLNYLNQPTITLTVLVTDRGNLATSANSAVVINLDKVDTIPPVVQDGSATIAENTANGMIVGQVVAAPGQLDFKIASYKITTGNTLNGSNAFKIDSVGVIRVNDASLLDFEKNPLWNLTILVTDNGTPTPLFSTATFSVNLSNKNEQITMGGGQSFSVNEGASNGFIVGQIATNDPDNEVSQIQSQAFFINGGNTSGAFTITPQGQLVVVNSAALNANITSSFSITTTVTDNGVPPTSATTTFTVSVIPQHQPPIVSPQSFNIPQHSIPGAVVGTVNATIHNSLSGTLSYAITGGDPTGAFAIDATTGKITVTDPHLIDFATTPKFTLSITVTDSGSPTSPISLSTTVKDTVLLLNGSSPQLTGLTTTIPERSPVGTIIGSVTASNGAAPYTYSFLSGNVNGAFAIDANGQITVANSAALDFITDPVFTLKVLVKDNESPQLGDTSTVTVNLLFIDLPPVLTGLESSHLTWVENPTTPTTPTNNNVPAAISSAITVTDPDSTNASGATIQITGNYKSGEDQLAFANTAKITGVWNAATATLTLSGIDTLANYTAALRSVTYKDLSDAPNTLTRTISYTVTDSNGAGSLTSAAVTRSIDITPSDDPPALTGLETTPLTWTENSVPPGTPTNNNATTPISSAITVADADSANVTGATIKIAGNYKSTEDQLVFTNTAKISGTWNPATGIMTLTGVDTLANYTAAIRSVSYKNTSDSPNTLSRNISYSVTDGTLTSSIVTRAITVVAADDPPALLSVGAPLTWVENPVTPPPTPTNNNVPAVISTTITVTDPDSTTMQGATIAITGNYQNGEDQLGFVNTANLTGVWNAATGTLTLSGVDTVANYTAALQSVTYVDLSDNPSTLTRTVTFNVTDSNGIPLTSPARTSSIQITPSDDPPVLAGLESTPLNWVENPSPPGTPTNNNNKTPISSAITIADPDSLNMNGATVQIAVNYRQGEDMLVFTNTANITGIWNAATGTMALSGTDTVANYNAALQAVRYTDISDAPNTSVRTVRFNVTDSDGPLTSAKVTRQINITTADDPPALTGLESLSLNWVENPSPPGTPTNNNVAAFITSAINVTDPDSTMMSGATIQITGNYKSGEDVLGFANTANITGVWNPANGTMTLTGVDTLANYATALHSVTYKDISDAPNTSVRTVSFKVTDNNGPLTSPAVTRTITITPANDPPVLTGLETTPLNWVENATPPGTPTNNNNTTPVSSAITVTDPDSTMIQGATIQIVANYQSSQDQLVFVNTPNISGVWDSTTGILRLTGVDTLTNYTAALQSVSYFNSSDAPSTATRTVTYAVTDSSGATSLPSAGVTRSIQITPADDPPVLTGLESISLNWFENPSPPATPTNNNVPAQVSAAITVTDPDSANIGGATIQITGNYQNGQDQLLFANTAKISGVWNAATGTLKLTGVDTLANYTAALQSVAYKNTSDAPNTAVRTVSFSVTDSNGPLTSPIVTRTINVVPANDPPALAGLETTPLNWIENATPPLSPTNNNNVTPISAGITDTDPDSATSAGAVIQISGNYRNGEDQLVFTNTAKITGVWDAKTGTMTLTGVDTLANYTAAIRSVAYTNISDTPNTSVRTLSFFVIDSVAALPSPTVTRLITITPSDDPPVLTGLETGALSWIENAAGSPTNNVTPISSAITVTDPDSASISGATIKISGNYQNGQDQLVFTNTANISGVWNAATGTMTLTGVDTLANYTAALQSVAYTNVSDNPNTLVRIVSFSVTDSDGPLTSPIVSRAITITSVDDPSVLAGLESTPLNWLENSLPPSTPTNNNNVTPISSAITVTDVDSTNAQGATIQISGNYQSGEDLLVFTNTAKISGVWNAATGTMTLIGVDTLANYTAAIRSVSYTDLSDNPNTAVRTIKFDVTDSSGLVSSTVTRNIDVVPVDDPPALIGLESAALGWIENAPGNVTNNVTSISSAITVVDPDSANIGGATIKITGNYQNGEDKLVFTNTNNISGVWNAATGTLTLSGADTLANYTAALQSVGYTDLSNSPSTLARTVSFTVTDSNGPLTSPAVTRIISIIPANDPPALTGLETSPLTWIENSSPPATPTNNNNVTPITAAIKVTDPDSVNAQSATIKIIGNYQNGQDQLVFTNTATISGVWDATTGTMTLTGVDTLANYTAALQSVAYTNLSDAPNTLVRNVRFSVTDDGGLTSPVVTRAINIIPVNDPPALTGLESTPLNWVENASPPASPTNNNVPAPVSAAITVTDPDSANISGATIQITGNYQNGQDQLLFTNTSTISGVWNAATGALKLSGVDTLANYTAALRSVEYKNLSDAPNTLVRTVSYSVSDSNGPLTSPIVSRTIKITPVNDPPILTGLESTPLNWVENALPPLTPTNNNNVTAITSAITATDPDSLNISGATIQISGNYQSNQDRLIFTNTAKITGFWNVSSGLLTLSGIDTLANYTAAIRSVSYTDISDTPNVSVRNLTIKVTDDSGLASPLVTRSIKVIAADDPPVLMGLESPPVTYTENAGTFATTPITAFIGVTDPDSTSAQQATIRISGNYKNGQDQLNFTDTANITGSWNASTGTLTLSGVDTMTNYQLAIRSVTYQNLSHNPSVLPRTVSFNITDIDGPLTSASVTRQINIVPVNNPSVLASTVTNLAYREGSGAKPINSAITVSDVDSTTLLSATITLKTFIVSEDVIGFVPNSATMGNIILNSNTNGVLSLISLGATATVAQWQAALRAVTYTNTSGNLNPPVKTVTFQVNDGGTVNSQSNTVSSTITITPLLPPVLANVNTLAYTEQNPPTAINTKITLTSASFATLSSATIRLTNFVSGEDVLGFVNNGLTMGNIAVQSNSAGTLTLISAGSTATVAQWQAALRAVTYNNTSFNPTLTARDVTFQVNDGASVNNLSNALASTITITKINIAPVLSGIESSVLNYNELSTTTSVTSSIVVNDLDPSTIISSATVRISGNYQSSQDSLKFANTSNITGVFNSVTGTLTLTGADSLANYQAALRSIKFYDSSITPVTLQRTVSFAVTNAANQTSNVVTRKVNVILVENPLGLAPALSGIETTNLQYLQDTPPNYAVNNTTPVSTSIKATDGDSANLNSATIRITTNYQSNQDVLVFNNTSTITGSWNASTGTLTLLGKDTLANYTTALRSVSYHNSQNIVSTLVRTVTYTVTDTGGLSSNSLSRNVNVIPVNKPPLLTPGSLDAGALSYTQDATAKAIIPNVLVADPDSTMLMGATIRITAGYNAINSLGQSSLDTLVFKNTATITGSWNATTGTLTLTGVDSVSNYRTALRSVQFFNQHDGLTPTKRTVSFTVKDSAGLSGNTISRDINITAASEASILSGIETTAQTYLVDPDTAAPPVTSTLAITDYNSTTLSGATVKITGGFIAGQDKLTLTTTGTSITGSFSNGILTLSGTDTLAHYQAVLRSVVFSTSANPSSTATRTISFQVTDNTAVSSNIVTRNVTIVKSVPAPTISIGSSTSVTFTQGQAPIAIVPTLTVTDPYNVMITGATIKFTGNYQLSQDVLAFKSLFNIVTAGFSSTTGTLTLTGADTLAHYQTALRTVTYANLSGNPSALQRTLSIVVNKTSTTSNVVTQHINVVRVNQPPVVTINSGALAYKPANGAVALAPALAVTDPDSTMLTGATIQLTFNYQRGSDVLSFLNTSKITGTFDIATGILKLTGTDTVANYRAALRSVTYKFNGTPIASSKTVAFVVSDGALLSSPANLTINVTP